MKKLLVSLLMACLVLCMVACGSNTDDAPAGNENDVVVDNQVETEPADVPETEPADVPETEPVEVPETEPVEVPETEPVEVPETEPAPVAPTPVEPAPVEPAPAEPEVVLENSPYVVYGAPYYDANTGCVFYFYLENDGVQNYDAINLTHYNYACEYYTECTGKTGAYAFASHPMGTYVEGKVAMAQVFIP